MSDDDPAAATGRAMLTLFCGLPGSGKSTLARRLAGEGAGVRLCTDEYQPALGVSHTDVALHERLQRRLYELALVLLEHGTDVVLEDGLWTRREREEKLADARARGARVVLHVLDVPVPVLWDRLQARNLRGHPDDCPIGRADLDRAAVVFVPPDPDELRCFDEVHQHSG